MVNWIFPVLVLVALVVFFKTTGVRFGKTWTVIIGIAILFFVLSFGYILLQPSVDATSFEGFIGAIKIYFTWLGGVGDNAASITGNVINTDWSANATVVGRE